MIKIIALDLDGTTLSPDHTISERNMNAIKTAKDKGIDVIIATGRGYLDAIIPLEKMDTPLPFITLNGSETRDEQGTIISATHMMQPDVHHIVTTLETNAMTYDLFIGDHLYTKNIDAHVNMYLKFTNQRSKEIVKLIQKEVEERVERGLIKEIASYDALLQSYDRFVYKVLGMSADDSILHHVSQSLSNAEGLAVTSSGIGNIEINSRDAQKGIALETYAKSKGISMEEVMVIGDNYNDISMMKKAGVSVAMDNAPNEIKKYCKQTTASNEEDGVALAIESVLPS